MDIIDCLKGGTDVVYVSLGDATLVSGNVIKMDTSYCSTIRSDKEIKLAINKRFKGKNTLYSNPTYTDIISWCLSSDIYKVCSDNLDSVSNDDVEVAWQFIDTMSVSSTPRCRDVITHGKRGRSAAGFARSRDKQKRVVLRNDRIKVSSSPPRLVQYSPLDMTGHETIESVLIEDSMRWVLESDRPVSSCATLVRNIRKGD